MPPTFAGGTSSIERLRDLWQSGGAPTPSQREAHRAEADQHHRPGGGLRDGGYIEIADVRTIVGRAHHVAVDIKRVWTGTQKQGVDFPDLRQRIPLRLVKAVRIDMREASQCRCRRKARSGFFLVRLESALGGKLTLRIRTFQAIVQHNNQAVKGLSCDKQEPPHANHEYRHRRDRPYGSDSKTEDQRDATRYQHVQVN